MTCWIWGFWCVWWRFRGNIGIVRNNTFYRIKSQNEIPLPIYLYSSIYYKPECFVLILIIGWFGPLSLRWGERVKGLSNYARGYFHQLNLVYSLLILIYIYWNIYLIYIICRPEPESLDRFNQWKLNNLYEICMTWKFWIA